MTGFRVLQAKYIRTQSPFSQVHGNKIIFFCNRFQNHEILYMHIFNSSSFWILLMSSVLSKLNDFSRWCLIFYNYLVQHFCLSFPSQAWAFSNITDFSAGAPTAMRPCKDEKLSISAKNAKETGRARQCEWCPRAVSVTRCGQRRMIANTLTCKVASFAPVKRGR